MCTEDVRVYIKCESFSGSFSVTRVARRKNNLGHQRAFKDCRSRNIPKVVTKTWPFCIHFSHFQGISSFLHFSFLYSSLEFQLLIESRLRREKPRLCVQIPVMNSSKHILIFQFSGNRNPQ